jgi:sister chromatid cohesion protein DCC1
VEVTKEYVRGEVQASDGELSQAFKEFHILDIDGISNICYSMITFLNSSLHPGHLRPISPSYLTLILENLLTALVSQGLPLPPNSIPINRLTHYLDLEHEVPRRVTEQILLWFGTVRGDNWEMDQTAAVKQVGLGKLMAFRASLSFRDRYMHAF